MYALRERRVHVTQEDFELAVAKVRFNPIMIDHILDFLFLIFFKGIFFLCTDAHTSK